MSDSRLSIPAINLLPGLNLKELETLVADLGEPSFRARQLSDWLYQKAVADPQAMNNLPAGLRAKLTKRFPVGLPIVEETLADPSNTVIKYLLALPAGGHVETVRIENTVCLSSQIGCPAGCQLCRTATMGFHRQLLAGEILGQFLVLQRMKPDSPLRGVVFMGMGEPLLNQDEVFKALKLLTDPQAVGLGARHITVSTVGIVPGIEALAELGLPVTLAVSLHAPDDELRNRLVPINRKFPLRKLLPACAAYFERTGRRLSYEYCLLGGVNDRPDQARSLARLLDDAWGHVNLIRFNPFPGSEFNAPEEESVRRFRDILDQAGLPVTIRASRGAEILAGCGQLATERGFA